MRTPGAEVTARPSFTVPWSFVEATRPAEVVAGARVEQRTFRRSSPSSGAVEPLLSVSVIPDPDVGSPLAAAALVGADPDLFSPALPFVRDVRAADGATHAGYWFDGGHMVVVHGIGVTADEVAAVLSSIR